MSTVRQSGHEGGGERGKRGPGGQENGEMENGTETQPFSVWHVQTVNICLGFGIAGKMALCVWFGFEFGLRIRLE